MDRWLTKKPNLVSYLGHASSFSVRGPNPGVVHAHAIVVANTGREAASNVRIGHHVMPEHYQLNPQVQHEEKREPNNSGEILIQKLVPGEQVTIFYLYFPPLLCSQIHSYTKSDEGFAKILHVLPTPQLPKPVQIGLRGLIGVGTLTLAYLATQLVIWLIQ